MRSYTYLGLSERDRRIRTESAAETARTGTPRNRRQVVTSKPLARQTGTRRYAYRGARSPRTVMGGNPKSEIRMPKEFRMTEDRRAFAPGRLRRAAGVFQHSVHLRTQDPG